MRILFSFTFFLFFLLSNAQDKDPISEGIKEAAAKGGYGVILIKNGTRLFTQTTTAFKDVVQIDAHAKNLFEQLASEKLKSPEAQNILLSLSRQMVTAGVAYRSEGNLKNALWCYRVPFYITCTTGEWTGGEIISNNIWMAKELIKHSLHISSIGEGSNITIDSLKPSVDILNIVKKDASQISGILNIKNENSGIELLQLQTFKRLADFSESENLSRSYLRKIRNQYKSNDQAAEIYINALVEELAQTSIEDLVSKN